jgi:hypothetical protein
MGLDDEAEKLRQAEEWLREGCPTIHRAAAVDHITHVFYTTERQDLRHKAYRLLQEVNEC